MSGPDINRPGAGSNAIGRFEIGISPIGTIAPFDYWLTIISQYANSPTITGLIGDFFDWIDQTANFDNFFDDIWNLDTAQGYGLDVWGRIVGVTRIVPIPGDITYFGFQEDSGLPFGTDTFNTGSTGPQNFVLTDPAFRTLILAKALSNICDGSIPAINQLLLNLFPGRGNCYVTDNEDMTMTYTFSFPLTAVEFAIVSEGGVLPKPAGVSVEVVVP